jgi:hypothetical protein
MGPKTMINKHALNMIMALMTVPATTTFAGTVNLQCRGALYDFPPVLKGSVDYSTEQQSISIVISRRKLFFS